MLNKPAKFLPARDVYDARPLARPPPFIRHIHPRGRRAAGLRYERKTQRHLCEAFGDAYTPGPWIEFRDGPTRDKRWCQPDGVLIDVRRGRITVVEIKYTHTELAYWQLFELYIPVLRALFPAPQWHFAAVEVCARYDCAVICPETPVLRKRIEDAFPRSFNVHIWRP